MVDIWLLIIDLAFSFRRPKWSVGSKDSWSGNKRTYRRTGGRYRCFTFRANAVGTAVYSRIFHYCIFSAPPPLIPGADLASPFSTLWADHQVRRVSKGGPITGKFCRSSVQIGPMPFLTSDLCLVTRFSSEISSYAQQKFR